MINPDKTLVSDAIIMTGPGRNPAISNDEVVIVLMPTLLPGEVTPKPRPLPDKLPPGYIGGGALMPGLLDASAKQGIIYTSG